MDQGDEVPKGTLCNEEIRDNGKIMKTGSLSRNPYDNPSNNDYQYIQESLSSALNPIGLDVHPFMVGWYNEKVGPKFHLGFPPETLAFVIINGPEMFEKCIVPYVKERLLEDNEFHSNNLMDDSMKHAFAVVQHDLKLDGFETEILFDFDLYPSRKPKVLVQTAAHVAGAVQYLHKKNLPPNIQLKRFGKKSNLNGVAIHPKYGGWFAIRGVLIIKNFQIPHEKCFSPKMVKIFSETDEIARILELFAYHWQTNEWRDIHEGLGVKYSENFRKYLSMESSQRWEFVRGFCEENPSIHKTMI